MCFDYHKNRKFLRVNFSGTADLQEQQIYRNRQLSREQVMGKGTHEKSKKAEINRADDKLQKFAVAAEDIISIFIDVVVSIYMFLIIIELPLYFENGYEHIGSDKSYIFRQISFKIGIFAYVLLLMYIVARIVEKRHDIIGLSKLKKLSPKNLSLTDMFVLIYAVGVIVSYICSAFRSVMNKTINNYIKEKRLDLAVQYLKADIPITEAAEQAGFNNYSYFYKTFKSVYGISTVEYRNRTLQENDER